MDFMGRNKSNNYKGIFGNNPEKDIRKKLVELLNQTKKETVWVK